jgi:eukaryotic-like serine/threonine-protein kinase
MREQVSTELHGLLDALLDQPEPERLQWIEQLPDRFEHLKGRLRELIARKPLSTLPKLVSQQEEASNSVGSEVGPYRLQRVLGSGGMGTVWLARRSDGLLDRDVAVKIPHGLWQEAGLAERMAGERQILAALSHRNIARLYDAGIAADGRPYLALEYIEGQPIDDYCKSRGVSIRERLALFAQVADAVAYAHGKLVVHRDLKPANILVTPDGQVRLLDFGIAKLLDRGRAEHTALTQLSGRALTPDYASPEQVRGEPVTVASDVYSLGVVLYELLTDSRPYTLHRDSRSALEDAILESDPMRPSESATTRSNARELRGDLDTIVLKTLKKAPQDRYATVNALADDIARYLCGRPVLARPDSVGYRVARFVGRHRVGVSVATAVLVALTCATVVALWQARAAVEQRERAEQVKDFVLSILRDADPYSRADGKLLTAAGRLQQARMRAMSELSRQPQVQIELLVSIGEGLKGLAQYDAAADTLRQALQSAATLGPTDDITLLRLHRLISEAQSEIGQIEEARRHLGIALAIMNSRKDDVPPAEAVALQLHRSAMAVEDARFDEALAASRAALQIAGGNPMVSAQAVSLAWRFSAVVHRALGDARAAIDEYGRAYHLAMEAYQGNELHPFVMEARMGYARALLMENRWREALVHMEGATQASTEVFGPDNDLTGNFTGSLGDVQAKLGDLREGIANCRRSLALYESQAEHGSRDHAARLRLLGKALLAARESEEASQLLAQAIAMRAHVTDHFEVPVMRVAYAHSLILLGRLDEAERELERIDIARIGQRTEILIDVLFDRGMVHRLRGQFDVAEDFLQRAMTLASTAPGPQYMQAQILNELGAVELASGRGRVAFDRYDSALARLSEAQQHKTPLYAEIVAGRSRANAQLGRSADALADTQAARDFWRDFAPASEAAKQTDRELRRQRSLSL